MSAESRDAVMDDIITALEGLSDRDAYLLSLSLPAHIESYFDLRFRPQPLEEARLKLQAQVPLDGIAPAETFSEEGQAGGISVQHVDAFLYTEEEVDERVDEGTLSRSYCRACKSLDVSPLEFISHSFSMDELSFLFHYALPPLEGKTLVDVGSRLGAVLLGAATMSGAERIVGVELNEYFCRLQEEVLADLADDRLQVVLVAALQGVIQGDILDHLPLLQQADVVVLNNPFQFFLEPAAEQDLWCKIRAALCTKGQLLVAVPSFSESPAIALAGIDVDEWVTERDLDLEGIEAADAGDLEDLHVYTVN